MEPPSPPTHAPQIAYSKVATWVKKHEIIAEVTDIFGNLRQRYLAPEDGIIVGKATNPVCTSGSRLIHLGIVSNEFAVVAQDGHA